jgi:branched-chain amino acid transport system ATP-binding protein
VNEQVTTPEPLLRLSGINTFYGLIHILQDVEIAVGAGELVSLLGGNASGKSTTLKTILGIVRPKTGAVSFNGEDVTGRSTSHRIGRGMAIVPENRRLFGPMTVLENLEMGAYLNRDGKGRKDDFERVYSLFPLVYERRSQLAGTLSGGEQQMVAMGRALMSHPKLLLMDEPSMGLAPILVERSFEIIQQVHESGARRRAEREHGSLDRRPWLRALDRPHRARRKGERTAGARGPAKGVPWPLRTLCF